MLHVYCAPTFGQLCIMGLMHQNMHIVYWELNESVLVFEIVFLLLHILNGILISVALYNFFHSTDKRMCVIVSMSHYLNLNHKLASMVNTM